MREAAGSLPPHLQLAYNYAPTGVARERLSDLFVLDSRLGDIVRNQREPLPAQMRLAWWRDTLGSPVAEWPVGDPLLARLREWRSPGTLIGLVNGWELLLVERLGQPEVAAHAAGRAGAWTALADELGAAGRPVVPSARTWALADLAANLSDLDERALVVEFAGRQDYIIPGGRMLRPLAILGALGRRAIARGGRPLLEGRGAALTAFRVGLFGR